LPRKFLQTYSNAFQALLSVAFNFLPKSRSSDSCLRSNENCFLHLGVTCPVSSGDASSDSESESRVQDSGDLGTGIESSRGTGLKAEGILGCPILCVEYREKRVILVMEKQQSFKWSRGPSHTIGTTKDIDLWVPFTQPAKVLEHELLQIFGAQTLS
jgi:hypothetical protein